MNKRSEHETHVGRLNLAPWTIEMDRNGSHNLTDIVLSGTVNMIVDARLIGQPDGVLIDKYGQFVVFEYKCNWEGRDVAVHQLTRASYHIKRYFGEKPRTLFIYGPNDTVEEIFI